MGDRDWPFQLGWNVKLNHVQPQNNAGSLVPNISQGGPPSDVS